MNGRIPNLEWALEIVLKHEGGFSDHAADRGGRTNFGITQETLDGTDGKYGVTDVAELTRDQAADIYNDLYWRPAKCAQIGVSLMGEGEDSYRHIQGFYFDCCVNHGVGGGGRILQRAINLVNRAEKLAPDITVDGAVGPGTIAALTELCSNNLHGDSIQQRLYAAMLAMRAHYYVEITESNDSQEVFFHGWITKRVGEWIKFA